MKLKNFYKSFGSRLRKLKGQGQKALAAIIDIITRSLDNIKTRRYWIMESIA